MCDDRWCHGWVVQDGSVAAVCTQGNCVVLDVRGVDGNMGGEGEACLQPWAWRNEQEMGSIQIREKHLVVKG